MKPTHFLSAMALTVSLPAMAGPMGEAMEETIGEVRDEWHRIDWGEFLVRVGGSHIRPDDRSSQLKFVLLQSFDLYRTRWEFDSETTWNISAVWRPMEHWGVELMYIDGAEYDVDLSAFYVYPGRNSIDLGKFEATSSNVFINWYPLEATCLWRPYLGLGVNYTDYHDDHLDGEFSSYLVDADLATGPGVLRLGHSWGPAAQIGADVTPIRSTPLLLNFALLYFKSDTDATVRFPTRFGTDRLRSKFDYDPWVINFGIGYKF
ncbi:OmpW/AlkL family protein [Microbulbifer yueqingensis]|uniref:Outer membrane protein W n=1 Tax=Microbulbifer yueqingensis TaxID=658219 RepID=A0A1G8XSC2_9GAMM|nr:OmpW family outer membrane protein [Microbulbifer yueqingensis]SDJ93458.1 Outer membrane protein W [Microbulbifer yueqingensis]